MVRKVQVLLIDDLDGGAADETMRFGVDGGHYEIDVSAENAGALRDALAPFVAVGRKIGRRTPSATRRIPTPPATGAPQTRGPAARHLNQQIRTWATQHGLTVNDRGRIPADLIAKYEADQGAAG